MSPTHQWIKLIILFVSNASTILAFQGFYDRSMTYRFHRLNQNQQQTKGDFTRRKNIFASASKDDRNEENSASSLDKRKEPKSYKREEFIVKSASLLSVPLFLSCDSSLAAETAPPLDQTMEGRRKGKSVVITGCNSGIGYEAALRMAKNPDVQSIILACRSLEKSQVTASRIKAQADADAVKTADLIPMECNLADLSSIRSFVGNLQQLKNVPQLDVVCLNAGLARDVNSKDVKRTAEGFELTIGTNHLGHFYLNKLLLPMVSPKTGRIVVTASGVHDPDSPGGAQGSKATLGTLRGLEEQGPLFEMVDGGPFDPDKAYKDSKLCNVLFTRELQKRLDRSGKGINAYCFNPGLIVGTGLFRDQNPIFTKVFDVAATNVFRVGETSAWGGGALAYVALDPTVGVNGGGLYFTSPPGSSKFGESAYGNQFKVSEVSKEARDDNKAERLWELSDQLVGG